VNLDEPVPPSTVGSRQCQPRAQQEREVLDEIGPQARALMTLDAEPANTEAAAALRQVRLLERIESLDPALAAGADAAPQDLAAQLAAADVAFAGNDVDAALRRLLTMLVGSGESERDAVRERLLEYFELLGADDPRVAPARRELARALF